jgi:hypothetical protein
MELKITKEIKEEFEKFCKKEFKNHFYISNKNNDNKWFYVQANKDLPPSIHYEYLDGNICLHIETESKELNKFIKDKVSNKNKLQDSLLVLNKVKAPMDLVLLVKQRLKIYK